MDKNIGTFKDNLKSPVHNWFKYPAGYSYKLVQALIEENHLSKNQVVFDPFCGSATNLVTCKQMGQAAVGIESHPFVHWVGQTKLKWEYDLDDLKATAADFISQTDGEGEPLQQDDFPDLIHRCYSTDNLRRLNHIRVQLASVPETYRDFFTLALVNTLREASSAGTGWPYISPKNDYHGKTEKPAHAVYSKILNRMIADLVTVHSSCDQMGEVRLIHGDSRVAHDITPGSVSLTVSSPPYLNNFDYADRTRLEMYFLGWAKTWKDMTEKVRNVLMVSATTQVTKRMFLEDGMLTTEMKEAAPEVYAQVAEIIALLAAKKKRRAGKKNYDMMTAGYFNDIFNIVKHTRLYHTTDSKCYLVLGDSAPYGVHIPTDEIIGRIGVSLGFKHYDILPLRTRGDKWANNPQRQANVPLRETILVLQN